MRCALDTGRHRRQVVQNRNECAANLGASLPMMVPSGPDTHQTQQLPVPDPELRIKLGAIAPLGGQVRQ